MKANLTLDEIEADIADTKRDISCLKSITDSLRVFIYQPGSEDRSMFKVDLFKYEVLLTQGRDLLGNIIIAKDKLVHPTDYDQSRQQNS